MRTLHLRLSDEGDGGSLLIEPQRRRERRVREIEYIAKAIFVTRYLFEIIRIPRTNFYNHSEIEVIIFKS